MMRIVMRILRDRQFVCVNTDYYLDLHMSRIILLTFWHIYAFFFFIIISFVFI